jgi:hypothetical protein
MHPNPPLTPGLALGAGGQVRQNGFRTSSQAS